MLRFISDRITVNGGPEEYSEYYDENSFLKMPFNAMVNIGYVIIGIYWLIRIKSIKSKYSSYSKGMSILAIIYGPLQFGRIVTQNRWMGIIDQWITLPFFMLGVLWALDMNGHIKSYSSKCWLMATSVISYWILAPFHPSGFEIALGLHLILVIYALADTYLHMKTSPNPLFYPLLLFSTSCFLFVVPKLYDHELARMSQTMFGTLTGHFWSKIGDFMQIHYGQLFFYTAEQDKKEK
jgi:hypothetical protein